MSLTELKHKHLILTTLILNFDKFIKYQKRGYVLIFAIFKLLIT